MIPGALDCLEMIKNAKSIQCVMYHNDKNFKEDFGTITE